MNRTTAASSAAALLALAALFAIIAPAAAASNEAADQQPRPVFREIWAYLMRGEENELTGDEPITRLCYFAANLKVDGRITDVIPRPDITLKNGRKPKIDLVIAELSNSSLMHFSLAPQYGVRPLLIDDICRVSADFDGVQIDFESVPRDDAQNFFDFLAELRVRLPAAKRLSIAVPARTGRVPDAYDYTRIAPLVDRMVIMAYDEHWSTSSPGPVASLPWCSQVLDYASSVVDIDKIVMGLPLYGRAWQDKKLAKALRFKNVQDLVAQTNSQTSYASDVGAWFAYSENVNVTVFYDDDRSIMEKLRLYSGRNVRAVSFWRIGQGPPQLWSSIDSAGAADAPAVAAPAAAPPTR